MTRRRTPRHSQTFNEGELGTDSYEVDTRFRGACPVWRLLHPTWWERRSVTVDPHRGKGQQTHPRGEAMSVRALFGVGLVAVLVALVGSPSAGVGASGYLYTLDGPNLASTASPFTGCSVEAEDSNNVNFPNTEPEPFVAVNPTNPLNVIGVYQQDRWSSGAAKAQGTAASTDGAPTILLVDTDDVERIRRVHRDE